MLTEISTEAKIAELQHQIVRANSWSSLFQSPEQEMADYRDLIGEFIAEYEGNSSLKEHRVELNQEGDIHILQRRDPGYFSTYQKLKSGDVIITFYYPNKQSSNTITHDIGNINHHFSRINTFVPDYDSLIRIGNDRVQEITGMDIANLHSYSGGKSFGKD